MSQYWKMVVLKTVPPRFSSDYKAQIFNSGSGSDFSCRAIYHHHHRHLTMSGDIFGFHN